MSFPHSLPASCRAVDCIWHCCHECFGALATGLFCLLSGRRNRIALRFPAELICAWIRTKFCSSKKAFSLFPTVLAGDNNLLSVFPRFCGIVTLFFSSFRSLKPFPGLRKLDSPFFKIKSSFLPVSFKMFRPVQHLKIGYFIVVLVTVLVMNIHSFGNSPVIIDPHPALSMDGHVVYPISILLFPECFTKIFTFFRTAHKNSLVSTWLMSVQDYMDKGQAVSSHPFREVSLH